jgi:t-SNARE complex subunit (syntaxin)
MRITKRQLKSIIRQEKRRILENCGEAHADDVAVAAEPVISTMGSALMESGTSEQDMLVEMEVASRSLVQVVESVQNAAQLCHNCGDAVAEKAPVVEAMVAQAEALQEMLEAQVAVIQESVDVESDLSLTDDVVLTIGD